MSEAEDQILREAETELLGRAREGDEDAFGELVRAHYERVFRLIVSILHDEHAARDVAQEVWVAAWRRLAHFRGDSRFSTWIHPIAVRRAIDHLRKRRRWYSRFLPFRDGDSDEAGVAEPAAPDDPRADVERAEREASFGRALAALPPKHRAVLALREVQGMSYEEIASALKCRPGTVMSRLYHARRLLARRIGDLPCE